ncbi:uncharacterized protein LOC117933175 [Vitis riparia]|uniref:uncharacterized protein LOC117933175 n=1 Tax=Vitis riparia TaxID=96939 RepID=UPI00155B2DF5|nr:uncharacterized protein LOC117933175 [Vitis riparia]
MTSNLTPSSGQDSTTHSQSSRSKTDPAWEHVSEERYGNGRRALICLYCKSITKGGGIHRMKLHLAGVKGDIGPCKLVPPDVRFRMENSLQEFVNAKKATKEADEYRNPYGPNVSQFEGDMAEGEEEVQEMQSPMAASSGKRKKSTMDKYFAPRNTEGAQPSMRGVLAGKEATWRADMAIGRFFYDACIPTNAMNSFYFKPMLYLQLDAKKEVQLLVDSYRVIWAKVRCTIMGDSWTDNRQRTLINFLVYCPEGILFVKSVDASDIVKDATNLFQLFDEVIEWVGPLNVVHVVTDNAANYVAPGRLISQKHKHINWSPCAAHCLNLIFKDIGKIDHVAELVRRASKVTIFVYNHVALLSWLRKMEGWTEILRPGATRFATTFIALKSLHDHKHDLQALVTSKFFVDSRYSKDYKSQVAVSIILDNRFWNDCLIVVNLMSPLMRLLRIVDYDERPSMGYVYEGMYRCTTFTKVGHSNIEPNRIVFWM